MNSSSVEFRNPIYMECCNLEIDKESVSFVMKLHNVSRNDKLLTSSPLPSLREELLEAVDST